MISVSLFKCVLGHANVVLCVLCLACINCCFLYNVLTHAFVPQWACVLVSTLMSCGWLFLIDVRSPYVTPELNNELQCNVGSMWEKFTSYVYDVKIA